MPKNTTQKNSKGTKTTASKKVETKKTETKKDPIKKVTETKKVPVKKVTEKKVETKKIETKKDPIIEVETKVVENEVINETKGNEEITPTKSKNIVSKITENTSLVVALCIIILLIAALIFDLYVKRIPKTASGKEILATLNGKTITADDLYEELKEKYGTDALINIIDTYIADKEVEITENNKKYVDEVVNYYKDYAKQYGVDLGTFLSTYVGLNGITTEEEFRDYVTEDYKKTLVVTNYLADEASEEELKDYYKENYSDKLTVKHILIEIDEEEEDSEKADKEAYNKAKDLIETLNNTSSKKLDSKFEKLAEDNSDDTGTYSNGGLMENFTKNEVVPEFWEASEKLKDGEYTKKPIKTTYGYHIILKVSTTPVEKYKDIKEEVKQSYAESLLAADSTLLASKWDEIRQQYKMSIKDSIIKKDYKKTLKEATEKKDEKTEN